MKLNGKKMEQVNPDFLANLPEKGTFEGTYICPPEKEKPEARNKIGIKYLNWEE